MQPLYYYYLEAVAPLMNYFVSHDPAFALLYVYAIATLPVLPLIGLLWLYIWLGERGMIKT